MKYVLLSLLMFAGLGISAQDDIEILTEDINHFWEAYDELENCKTKADSIRAFQELYIDRATEGLIAFIKVRDFDAPEYYSKVKQYPKFWKSIRNNTFEVRSMIPEIKQIYEDYEKAYPGHKKPKICFAIGTLRTGGTTSSEFMLIGTEIVVADKRVDKSELGPWLKSVMSDEMEVPGMIAHEYIHTQQKNNMAAVWSMLNHRLLFMALREGSCDFLSEQITGNMINKHIHTYGNAHETEIWEEFQQEMYGNDYSNWLYQGNRAKEGQPADLGYYVGYKISEAYFAQANDKKKALKDILHIKNYKKLLKKSGYLETVDGVR